MRLLLLRHSCPALHQIHRHLARAPSARAQHTKRREPQGCAKELQISAGTKDENYRNLEVNSSQHPPNRARWREIIFYSMHPDGSSRFPLLFVEPPFDSLQNAKCADNCSSGDEKRKAQSAGAATLSAGRP